MTDMNDVSSIKDDGEKIENLSRLETASTRIEEHVDTGGENKKKLKDKTKRKINNRKCPSKKWTCDKETLWRIYMMSFASKQQKLKQDQFKERIPTDSSKLPHLLSHENSQPHLEYYPLNTFNQQSKTYLLNQTIHENKIRIWRKMRTNLPVGIFNDFYEVSPSLSKIDTDKWPEILPCIKGKLAEHKKYLEKKKRQKKKGVLPCYLNKYNTNDEFIDNYADHKELGHARISHVCLKTIKHLLVDRAAGKNSGLVDGNYIIFEFSSKKKNKQVFADVCLRGLKGMHVVELSPKREREKTWKFCFYQAIIALLTTTQLRYKYASSVNIDYIYDHAWMLFIHLGSINIRLKQQLDDIVVYNYKYSIELELIDELKDIPRITDVTWDFLEKTIKKHDELERKEIMHTPEAFGSDKVSNSQQLLVHNGIKKIEDWFDKLDIQHKNCIFRTSRFSLAFWKDGVFWYMYNPFRCNEFGFWDNFGYSCIMKFCSKNSLKRHLMILLLKAYTYEGHFELKNNKEDREKNVGDENVDKNRERTNQGKAKENVRNAPGKGREEENTEFQDGVFNIQIFQMIYHCCKIHNIKLLQRETLKPKIQVHLKNEIYGCPEDSIEFKDSCLSEEDEFDDIGRQKIEKLSWLRLAVIPWSRFSNSNRGKNEKNILSKKPMWHHYYVEEDGKLFSLWSQVHIKDEVFPVENRGKQTYACYIVCAGMTMLIAPEYWTSQTLNAILFCGDGYYTSSILEADAKFRKPELINVEYRRNYLSEYFKVGEYLFQVRILTAICGKLYSNNKTNLWKALEQCFLKYHFGILTCENVCLGIFKFCGAYYMFDVQSKGPPIFPFGTGTAYLLRATYFHKFITSLITMIGSPECSPFALNPIEIMKILELDDLNCFKKSNEEDICNEIHLKATCLVDDERKKKGKKIKKNRTC